MIYFSNPVYPSPDTWRAVVRGMRNPKNSWDKGDSFTCVPFEFSDADIENCSYENCTYYIKSEDGEFSECEATYRIPFSGYVLGENDLKLMKILCQAGSPEHAKFLRQLPIMIDITAPLYWWKQMDCYSVGTVTNSCSTMHKLTEKPFELSDFSCSHLEDLKNEDKLSPTEDITNTFIDEINSSSCKAVFPLQFDYKDNIGFARLNQCYLYFTCLKCSGKVDDPTAKKCQQNKYCKQRYRLNKNYDEWQSGEAIMTNTRFALEMLLDKYNETGDINYWYAIDAILPQSYHKSNYSRLGLEPVVRTLNLYRDKYLETGDKKYWYAINEFLPHSYMQRRTWSGNYEVLRNICKQRKGHPLQEWADFIEFVHDSVPFAKQLIFNEWEDTE